MKRIALCALCVIVFASGNLFAQNYSHWSIGLKGGVNRGQGSGGGVLKDGNYGYAFGAEVERTFNPLFGIALDYEYISYTNSLKKDGTGHEVSLLGSVNVSNLLAKYRKGNWQKLNIYGRMGAGVGFLEADFKKKTIVLPFEVALEYDLSKTFAIGVSGERRHHIASSNMAFNNGSVGHLWQAMFNLRVKFGANKNAHTRNTPLMDYEQAYLQSIAQPYDDAALKKNIANNEAAIKQLQDQIGKASADINKLNSEVAGVKDQIAKLAVQKPAATVAAKPGDVRFELGSSDIHPSSHGHLDAIAETLKSNPSQHVTLVGHCCNTGTEKFNNTLSVKRAETVASYLTKKGVPASQITTKGMGFSQPIASNSTNEGRAQNRRVEFIF